jgi:hypothetical protein
MKRKTLRTIAVRAILLIPHNRLAGFRQMHPNLVLPPGKQLNLK